MPRFSECRLVDRLVLTATGAYTMTSHRRFNRIRPPTGYPFGGSVSVVPAKERLWPLSFRNP
ncbi:MULTISPECIES: hypothetical protein [unclassified Streptomyces]|uniref:hypothetical protein n=1 Tax=Streptomyces sp. NPDC055082 TaxID=3365718 RepID=UPI0037D2273A